MSDNRNVVKQIVQLWQKNFADEQGILSQDTSLQDKAQLFNQLDSGNLNVVVFSFTDLSILYTNQLTAKLFGTTASHIMQEGAAFILSRFDTEQIAVAAKAAEITAPITHMLTPGEILSSYSCYVNWTIHSLSGEIHKTLFRIFPIQVNQRGLPSIGMYLIYDIKPFVKPDVWWYRMKLNETLCLHYQSEDKKFVKKDMLSEREKLILMRVAEGKSSKSIGAELNISQHTVDNHRRKMLLKTGAPDTSALIHLCKLSGIL